MNYIIETKEGILFDVRAIYWIGPLDGEQPYYSIKFIDGRSVEIYDKAVPRVELVKRWKEWVNCLNPEQKQSPYRKIEL